MSQPNSRVARSLIFCFPFSQTLRGKIPKALPMQSVQLVKFICICVFTQVSCLILDLVTPSCTLADSQVSFSVQRKIEVMLKAMEK